MDLVFLEGNNDSLMGKKRKVTICSSDCRQAEVIIIFCTQTKRVWCIQLRVSLPTRLFFRISFFDYFQDKLPETKQTICRMRHFLYSNQLVNKQRYTKSLPLSREYDSQSNPSVSLVKLVEMVEKVESVVLVELTRGIRTHFCFKCPMNSCNPIRANTLKQKTVRIITSASFFTDWNNAPTMVFRPARHRTLSDFHHTLK